MSTGYGVSINSANVKRAGGSALVVILYDVLMGKKKGGPLPEGEAGGKGKRGGKWMNSFKDGAVMAVASILNDLYFKNVLLSLIPAPPLGGPDTSGIPDIVGDATLYSTGQYLRGKKKFMMNFLLGAGASYVGKMIAPSTTDKLLDTVTPMTTGSQSSRQVTPDFAPSTLGQPMGNLQSSTGY